ncbi:MAG: hypothetical protein GYB67_04400 [Chloroflexi bacterium]|nr:hypothetical protein [Chloroflexota bacterium]
MSILTSSYANGIFSTEIAGNLSQEEAQRWLLMLREHAATQVTPVIALVDATRLEFISGTARMVIAEATRVPRVRALIFVVSTPPMQQAVRMIGMLGERDLTHCFSSMERAQALVEALRLNPLSMQSAR